MTMDHVERLEKAVHSVDAARSLRTLVLELSMEGHPKADIYEMLEKFLIHLRTG